MRCLIPCCVKRRPYRFFRSTRCLLNLQHLSPALCSLSQLTSNTYRQGKTAQDARSSSQRHPRPSAECISFRPSSGLLCTSDASLRSRVEESSRREKGVCVNEVSSDGSKALSVSLLVVFGEDFLCKKSRFITSTCKKSSRRQEMLGIGLCQANSFRVSDVCTDVFLSTKACTKRCYHASMKRPGS